MKHRHKCGAVTHFPCLHFGFCECECGARCEWEDGNKVPDGTVWITIQEREE